MQQIILHVDMDAFYAAVEMRDNPALRGKPLIIGSLPHERGVVATCNYEARKYGVRSGMNIKQAYNLCPNGVYLHPNFDKYKAVSAQLHAIWNTYARAAESVALDEAYLDVTQHAVDFDGARKIAQTIKQRTKDELGLSCSVGVAYSKTAAKTASEENKPNGYFEIRTPQDFVRLLKDRDVSVLYTVGSKTAEKLHLAGVATVGDIREKQEIVTRLLGKQGEWLVQLASGIDDRPVQSWRPEDAKSISREVTFQADVENFDLVDDVLFLLSLCVEQRAKRVGLFGSGVTLKLTYANMQSITRSRVVEDSSDAVVIYREAQSLLGQVEHRPVRLCGVGIYHLSEQGRSQISFDDYLEDVSHARQMLRNRRLLALQERYGLDFAGHLEDIYHGETLHKTIEYMRKHI